MDRFIEIRDLVKRYPGRGLDIRKGFLAVDRVSFGIERTGSFGLVGESGCGKTTLARSLLFLDPPSSGEVLLDGVSLGALSRKDLRRMRWRMQIIFQDPNGALSPKLSVLGSMEEGLANKGFSKAERLKRIDGLLELVGIPSTHSRRYPHEFSGGQKQRIVIARALSMEPDFLVLDEPVSSLDVSIQAQIINLLADIKEKFSLTYLFISHDLNLVSYLSGSIGVMYAGRLVETGPTDSILGRPAHPYTHHLFSSVPSIGHTLASGGGDADPEEAAEDEATGAAPPGNAVSASHTGCSYRGHCPRAVESCHLKVPELAPVGKDHFAACHVAEYRGDE